MLIDKYNGDSLWENSCFLNDRSTVRIDRLHVESLSFRMFRRNTSRTIKENITILGKCVNTPTCIGPICGLRPKLSPWMRFVPSIGIYNGLTSMIMMQ